MSRVAGEVRLAGRYDAAIIVGRTRVFVIIILQRRVIRLGEHKRIRQLGGKRGWKIVNVVSREREEWWSLSGILSAAGIFELVYIYLKFNISGEMVRDGYQGFIYSKFETLKTWCIPSPRNFVQPVFRSINSRVECVYRVVSKKLLCRLILGN